MGLYFVVREGYDVKRHHLYGCKESRLARLALPSHMTGSPCYCQCYCSASIHKQYRCFVIVNVIARPVFTNNISALLLSMLLLRQYSQTTSVLSVIADAIA